MPFSLVARYVVFRIIPWMGICLFGAAAVFLVTQLLRTAPIFIGANFITGMQVPLLLSVPVIAFSMGPAFLIALFAVAGKMSEDDELSAIDALGLRRGKIQLALVLFAGALTLVNAGLWFYGVPSAVSRTREVAVSLLRGAAEHRLHPGQFNRPAPNLLFFAEQKKNNGVFQKAFVEWKTAEQCVEVVAEEAAFKIAENFDVTMHFTNGRTFVTFSRKDNKEDESALHISVAFKDFELTVPIRQVLSRKLGFLPEVLCVSTAALLGPPGPGISRDDWSFAFWRRAAGPAGFFMLGFFGILVAFSVSWTNRSRAAGLSIAVFLIFHLTGRFAEALFSQGALPPAVAAFLPAAVCAFFCAVFLGFNSIRRRRVTGRFFGVSE
jgi:lipopolysaccharide export LptBFGC system permease protein LptF